MITAICGRRSTSTIDLWNLPNRVVLSSKTCGYNLHTRAGDSAQGDGLLESVAAVNPLSALTFISAPAVLTNASCVLLFGAGNRYARAVDRLHELSKLVDNLQEFDSPEAQLRVTQLDAAEDRALLIVRALTCFYGSVAAFVASTLICLLAYSASGLSSDLTLGVALLIGSTGVLSMIIGALLLVRETRASFVVLRLEKTVITNRLQQRISKGS